MKARSLDLDSLKLGRGADFEAQLDHVPFNLNDGNLKSFYETCFDLFDRKELSELTMSQVLSAIYRSLTSQGNLEQFCQWKFAEKLPFKKFHLMEQVLDVVYLIVTYAPHGITSKTANLFGHLITRYTRKCITILSVFAERFQIVLDPWKMIDLLFKYNVCFAESGSVNDYLSVLIYLNQHFFDFREARQQHTWNAICTVIERTKLDCVKLNCYYALCQLYETNPLIIDSFKFPKNGPNDLENEYLQHAVLSLLFRVPPNGIIVPAITALLRLAKKNPAAGLALQRLANTRACAVTLSRDLSWLNQDLPTKNDTASIFAKLLTFVPLRRELINHKETIDFLVQLVNNNSGFNLIAASAFIRRLPIDEDFHLNLI